jgi:hypothetical protein
MFWLARVEKDGDRKLKIKLNIEESGLEIYYTMV